MGKPVVKINGFPGEQWEGEFFSRLKLSPLSLFHPFLHYGRQMNKVHALLR